MPENAKPFVQIEFDVLLDGSAEETAAPASAFTMSDWSPHGSPGAKEEQIDVRIHLERNVNEELAEVEGVVIPGTQS